MARIRLHAILSCCSLQVKLVRIQCYTAMTMMMLERRQDLARNMPEMPSLSEGCAAVGGDSRSVSVPAKTQC